MKPITTLAVVLRCFLIGVFAFLIGVFAVDFNELVLKPRHAHAAPPTVKADSGFVAPADEVVTSNRLLTFGLDEALAEPAPIPAPSNGLPPGKWSSTLVVVETEANLFRDPATRKLYRVVRGEIVEETNPYAGLTLQQIRIKIDLDAKIAQWKLDDRRQQLEDNRQIDMLYEFRRANNIAESQSFQNQQAIDEIRGIRLDNRQAIDEIRGIRYDNQMNALTPRVLPLKPGER